MTISTETRAEQVDQASPSCQQTEPKATNANNKIGEAASKESGIRGPQQMETSMIEGMTKIAINTEVEVLPSAQCTALSSTCADPPLKRSAGAAVADSRDRPGVTAAPAPKRIKLETTQRKPPTAVAQDPEPVPSSLAVPKVEKDSRKPLVKSRAANPVNKPKTAAAGRPQPSKSPATTHFETKDKTCGPVTPDSVEKPKASTVTATSPSDISSPNAAGVPEKVGVPLKSSKMSHLSVKYRQELEYMLREFKKLERQLLGAKARSAQSESTGSRERREKLHSFILHLEDTIRQIEEGCRLESEGESGDSSAPAAAALVSVEKESAALTNLTKEKEEEEAVQKLEEHILANLLPVKVRLKKQLAAQQGATRNPVGAPTRRGMMPSAPKETGTFAVAAEKRRKAAAAAADSTQFGKPLSGSGSSLTQKLHGQTLGSKSRPHGDGVGAKQARPSSTTEGTTKKVLYAGMAPGSQQLQSGVSAASGAHKLLIESSVLLQKGAVQKGADAAKSARGAPTPVSVASATIRQNGLTGKPKLKAHEDPSLPMEERRRLRKLRRKKKKRRAHRRREKERQRQMLYASQAQQPLGSASDALPNVVLSGPKVAMGATMAKKKMVVKHLLGKKGPRSVEYICALCSEAYNSTCEYNPWWALTSHECPKCRKTQIPRIDISSPSNAIEYHPALLVNAEDANGSGGGSSSGGNSLTASSLSAVRVTPSHVASSYGVNGSTIRRHSNYAAFSDSEDSDLSELSDGGSLSDDSLEADGLVGLGPLSPAEEAENENFGKEYTGPVMSEDDAQRLLILMLHASTCPGRHKSVKHRDVCNSAKYMMLHVRDCPGTTATFDICPFPWCRKTKHLLYHLVTCDDPEDCLICTRKGLSSNLQRLVGLNDHRRKKHVERMKAAMAAAAKSKSYSSKVQYPAKTTKTTITRATATNPRKPGPGTKSYPAAGRVATKVGGSRSSGQSSKLPVTSTTRIGTAQPKTPNGVILKKGANGTAGTKTTLAVPVGAARKPIVALHPGVSGGGLKPTLHPGAKLMVKPSTMVVKPRHPISTDPSSSGTLKAGLKPAVPCSNLPTIQSPKGLVPPSSKGQAAKGAAGNLPKTSGSPTKPGLRTNVVGHKKGAPKLLSNRSVASTITSVSGQGPVGKVTETRSATSTPTRKGSVNSAVSIRTSVPAKTKGSLTPSLVPSQHVAQKAGNPAAPLKPSSPAGVTIAVGTQVAPVLPASTKSSSQTPGCVSNQVGWERGPITAARQSTPNTTRALAPPLQTAARSTQASADPKAKTSSSSQDHGAPKASVSTKHATVQGVPAEQSKCPGGYKSSGGDVVSTKASTWVTAPSHVPSSATEAAAPCVAVRTRRPNAPTQSTRTSSETQVLSAQSWTDHECNELNRPMSVSSGALEDGHFAKKMGQRRVSPHSGPLETTVLGVVAGQSMKQPKSAGGKSAVRAAKEVLERSIASSESESKVTKTFPQMPILPSVVKVEEEKKET